VIDKTEYFAVDIVGNGVSITGNTITDVEIFGGVGYPVHAIGILFNSVNNIIRNNTINVVGDNVDMAFGIFVDYYSDNNIIDSNIINAVTHVGIALAGGSYNTITNNIISNMTFDISWQSTGAIVLENTYDNLVQSAGNFIAFNTIYNTQQPIALNPVEGVETFPLNVIENNCFSKYVYDWVSIPTLPVATIRNNCWYDGPSEGSMFSLDTNPITGNPLFTSTSWFLPQASSSLISAAMVTNPTVPVDIRGIARPQAGTSDIGAYERQSIEPTTTSSTTTTYVTTTTISHTTGTSLSTTSTTTTYTFTTTVTTISTSRTSTTVSNTTRTTRTTSTTATSTITSSTSGTTTATTPSPQITTYYYVDITNGDDTNPGTLELPFKTLGQATLFAGPGTQINIQPGIYHEQIISGNSGTDINPIIYNGFGLENIVIRGSVTVTDWIKGDGNWWYKEGLNPTTDNNVFVIIDDSHKLIKSDVSDPNDLLPGYFYYDTEQKVYYIRLNADDNPNINHTVDCYELDFFIYAGTNITGATNKNHIIFRNLTIEKFGIAGILTNPFEHNLNVGWEFDKTLIQYNNKGIDAVLDYWIIHDCIISKNFSTGIHVDGNQVVIINNEINQNGIFGATLLGEHGILVGPHAWAAYCIIANNKINNNGTNSENRYVAGIYLDTLANHSQIYNNVLIGNQSAGVAFFGSSTNKIYNNIFTNMEFSYPSTQTAVFAFNRSTIDQSLLPLRNIITFNTTCNCNIPISIVEPRTNIFPSQYNKITNNLFYRYSNIYNHPIQTLALLVNNGWFDGNNVPKGFDKIDTKPLSGSDPMLRDIPSGDFTPLEGSPILDSGYMEDFITEDSRGVPRPQGVSPDIGACERLPYER
jgi:parallel beta-helix repeat protein